MATCHPLPTLTPTCLLTMLLCSHQRRTPRRLSFCHLSQYLRNLIFAHKKTALPKLLDLATNKQRNKFSIYEDLSPGNYAVFRSFADDQRVRSVWSYGGQVRFKAHDSEQVYKVRSIHDSFDSLVKASTSPSRGNR